MTRPVYTPHGRRASPCGQAGLSLIELMVGLVLSLFLAAGLVVMSQSSLQSYRVQNQNATLAQSERLAATFVGSVVQSAGYFNQPAVYSQASAFPASGAFSPGQYLSGTDGTWASGESDTLSLRMLPAPNDQVLNCLGQRNIGAAGQLYINQLTLDTAEQQLECTVSGPGIATQTQPILDGVISLRFLYGVDTDGDGSADRYLDAGAAPDWTAVRSVTMTVQFDTLDAATGNAGPAGLPVSFRATFPVRINSQ